MFRYGGNSSSPAESDAALDKWLDKGDSSKLLVHHVQINLMLLITPQSLPYLSSRGAIKKASVRSESSISLSSDWPRREGDQPKAAYHVRTQNGCRPASARVTVLFLFFLTGHLFSNRCLIPMGCARHTPLAVMYLRRSRLYSSLGRSQSCMSTSNGRRKPASLVRSLSSPTWAIRG
jgi:hypothetical protein